MSEVRARYPRTLGGLIGAICACLLLFVVMWGLSRLQQRDEHDPAPTVDYAAQLVTARREAPFDVLAPDPVPDGLRATSAQWQGAGPEVSWHLGFLTRQGEYVGLEQGNATPRAFVAASTSADQPGKPARVDGAVWGALTSADGDEQALVSQRPRVTTVVTGTAPRSELIAFAESLTSR